MPYRPAGVAAYEPLKMMLMKVNLDGDRYIAHHPYEDFTTFDWRTRYPEITSPQVAGYRYLAQAFQFVNKNWNDSELSLDNISREFQLPIERLGYINEHMRKLKKFQEMFKKLQGCSFDVQQFCLDKENQVWLEHFLDVNLSEMYERFSITGEQTLESLSSQQKSARCNLNVQVAIIVRNHPVLKNHEGSANLDQLLSELITNEISTETMLSLLDIHDMSAILKEKIIFYIHNAIDKESLLPIIFKIFDLEWKLSEEDLLYIASLKITNIYPRLISLGNLSENVWSIILSDHNFDAMECKEIIREFLIKNKDSALSDTFLTILLDRYKSDENILDELSFQAKNSLNLLNKILDLTHLKSDTLIQLIKQTKEAEHLSVICEKLKNQDSTILAELFKHELFDDKVLNKLSSNRNIIMSTQDLQLLIEMRKNSIEYFSTMLLILAENSASLEFLTETQQLSEYELKSILLLPNINQNVIRSVMKQQQFSLECATLIINRHIDKTDDVILKELITNKVLSENELIIIVNKSDIAPEVINAVIQHNNFSEQIAQIIVDKHIDKINNGLFIDKIIRKANENTIGKLCVHVSEFSDEECEQIASKISSNEQIHKFLVRNDMNINIAKIVFSKENYDFVIKDDWRWMDNDLLTAVLEKTRDYSSLKIALNKLPLKNCQDWLRTKKINIPAVNINDKKDELKSVCSKLKLMSYSLAMETIKHPAYDDAAKDSFELYVNISRIINNDVDNKNMCGQCEMLINAALLNPTLSNHRGYKQVLFDILNVLGVILSLGTVLCGDNWRLFTANTNRQNVVNQMKKHLKEYREEDDDNVNAI